MISSLDFRPRFKNAGLKRKSGRQPRVPRVLIVEDSPLYRQVLKETLHKHLPSLAIDDAGSAEEALQKISETSRFDLAFIDIHLPGMNGLQLIRELKKGIPEIRIAILTGYDSPEYEQAARRYGADRFFIKARFRWDEAEEFVRNMLNKNRGRQDRFNRGF